MTQSNFLTIPLFDLSGKEVTLEQYLGPVIVLYFYPKDDTPGCTKEACSFRDGTKELEHLGVKVLGVSKDSVASHNKFKAKFHLNFELLSDPEHKLQEALDVWKEKTFMGRKFLGTIRTTFVLSADGTVLKRFDNVKPDLHFAEVLEFLSK
jgi:thioredoxin-dependent peroxiredoxin